MGAFAEVLNSASLLAEGSYCMLYRAQVYEYGGDVILKVAKSPDDGTTLARLRQEYQLLTQLHAPGLRQVFDFVNIGQRPALVLEYLPGHDLKQCIRKGLPSLKEAVSWAIKLCQVVERVHREGYLHGGLCSRNILLADNQEIYLLDFGQTQSLPIEKALPADIFLNDESLPYLAPELTGRLALPIGPSADLYALGVVLYELLTGCLPYLAEQPQAVLHAHLTAPPPLPHLNRAEIPENLSALVARLMAKDPSDRYQSAIGLRYDLEMCLQQLSGNSVEFTLGQADGNGMLQVPEQLVGVQEEARALSKAWQLSCRGAAEMVWLGGEAGTGKSSLVFELKKRIEQQQHGYFLSGKYDQYQQNNRPYGAWLQAIEELIESLLTKSQAELNEWRERITLALGTEGRLITNLLPRLEAIIGRQPALLQLEGAEAQNRFFYTFRNFLRALASKNQPVVLFLDDLHWADAASLNLLQSFLDEGGCPFLLLVAAYRTDEVPEGGQLEKLLHRPADNLLQHTRLRLSGLTEEELNNLLAGILKKGTSITRSLAKVLYHKTNGNPLFITQFLHSIAEAGHLRFDWVTGSQSAGQWSWDIDSIIQMPHTENVVQLLQSRIAKLATGKRRILQMAACIGVSFQYEALSQAFSDSEEKLLNGLFVAVREGFLLEDKLNQSYRFSHDRIQQAVYATLSIEEQRDLHYLLGKALLAQRKTDREYVFQLTEHWNIAKVLLRSEEKDELFRLNQQAATQAREASAYEQSLRHLQHCIDLLPQSRWTEAYEESLQVYSQAAEAAYLSGLYEQMESYVQLVLLQARNTLDTVKVHEITLLALAARNRSAETVNYALEVLALFDVQFPAKPGPAHIIGGLIRTEAALGWYGRKKIEQLPLMTDAEAQAVMKLMAATGPTVSRNAPMLFPLWVYKLIRLSLQYGLTAESIPAFSGYGVLILAILGDSAKGVAYGELALRLQKKMGARAVEAKTYVVMSAFLIHWRGHLRDSLLALQHAYQTGLETGDKEFAASALMIEVIHEYQAGDNLTELAARTDERLGQIRSLNQELLQLQTAMFRQAIEELQQEDDQEDLLCGRYFNASSTLSPKFLEENKTTSFYYHFLLLQLNYFKQHEEAALNQLAKLEKNLQQLAGTMFIPDFYFYQGLVYAGSNQPAHLVFKKLRQSITKLKKWAKHAPMNFRHKQLLLAAEYYRLKKHTNRARRHYDEALEAAHKAGYLQDEALAYELSGRFMLMQDQGQAAEMYLNKAYFCYQRWGARAKASQLKKQFPLQFRGNLTFSNPVEKDYSEETHALRNLIELSQNISSDIRLDVVILNLMETLMKILGAQRGYLLLDRDEGFVPVARATSEPPSLELLKGTTSQAEQIPAAFINYTFRTAQLVLVNNALADKRFADDPTVKERQLRSVICMPIRRKDSQNGMVYFENSLASAAFQEKHLELVKMLMGQVAITLENALLYEQLEQRVEERTLQLESQRKILLEKNEALKSLNAEKDELVHIVAHDLRSPLSQIKGMLNLIQQHDNKLNADQQQYLDLSVRAADRLNRMIARILSINTLESQKLELKLEPIDLEILLEELAGNFQLQASEKNIDLELILPEESCSVELDRHYTLQVLENVLSNALKFSLPGAKVSISLEYDAGLVQIGIQDRGPGISAKDQKRLFSKFQTLSARPTGGEESSGLGLAIAKRFVEAMGGEISCDSELGEGTTFYICFPIV